MEGLLSFLVIGGLFFLMMRFGCGAHMAHGGHGGHSGHRSHDADNEEKHTDPVCGMEVDVNKGYGKMHDGQLYRFCSRNCLDKFEADPSRYLQSVPGDTGGAS
ncbi:MAG: YHS domain-containing protein [Gammaproteobacteria bacterium]|nr:YHS domain-containing protein [Gammaproteobacteria bacterium]